MKKTFCWGVYLLSIRPQSETFVQHVIKCCILDELLSAQSQIMSGDYVAPAFLTRNRLKVFHGIYLETSDSDHSIVRLEQEDFFYRAVTDPIEFDEEARNHQRGKFCFSVGK